jgi:hypothetical protein
MSLSVFVSCCFDNYIAVSFWLVIKFFTVEFLYLLNYVYYFFCVLLQGLQTSLNEKSFKS